MTRSELCIFQRYFVWSYSDWETRDWFSIQLLHNISKIATRKSFYLALSFELKATSLMGLKAFMIFMTNMKEQSYLKAEVFLHRDQRNFISLLKKLSYLNLLITYALWSFLLEHLLLYRENFRSLSLLKVLFLILLSMELYHEWVNTW